MQIWSAKRELLHQVGIYISKESRRRFIADNGTFEYAGLQNRRILGAPHSSKVEKLYKATALTACSDMEGV